MSIAVNDHEREYLRYHPDLDLAYVEQAAAEVAEVLDDGRTIEVNLQPGDGTRYGLVFVPLLDCEQASARIQDGSAWNGQAADGVGYPLYHTDAVLIAYVEHGAYPARLSGESGLTHPYVAEHWSGAGSEIGPGSAAMLAMFFRLVASRRKI